MTEIVVQRGGGPVVLGLPHTGTHIPMDVQDQMNPIGLAVADTDWNIDRLYANLVPDLTTVRTPVSRYVIDVNRDPTGQSLYPGQNTTTLCPTTDFEGRPIYRPGAEPDDGEVERRIEVYHRPYHEQMRRELERVQRIHGFAILYDAHSIRSHIPYLFGGVLPEFNVGTNDGATCDSALQSLVWECCLSANGYTCVLNGRFKGGWTTRHYGKPDAGIHAIQMELAQSTYMNEAPPWQYRPERADAVRQHLRTILTALSSWRPT